MQNRFDIYFSGEVLEGRDSQEVKAAVGKLSRLSGARLDTLFSGQTRRIKKDLNVEQAGHFREVFRKAGAAVQIVPAGQKPPVAPAGKSTATQPEPPSGLKLAPIGAELNTEPREVENDTVAQSPRPEPNLELAPIGPVPGDKPPAEADIDTGDLQAAPAASGSLEEFVVQKEPVPLPDISGLELVKDDKPIQALSRNSPRKRKLSKFRISAICHWTVESLTRKRPRGWRFSKSSGVRCASSASQTYNGRCAGPGSP
ncbi:hypothetical protein, partial [Thiolapillus sp.]|uniref:hypothetical protein n=3 Tax=Thiolapillus sp. TaxID=2017437 RepID=UPI0025E91D5D